MQKLFGNPENLTPEEMFKKYKLCQHVPYYASNPEAMQWMHERRSCDDTQRKLPAIDGAVAGVAELCKHVNVVAYLTVRPHKLAEGTAWWLQQSGFPAASVVCKPDEVAFEEGNAWKAGVLGQLYPHVRGMVDDNPSVLLSFVPDPKPTPTKPGQPTTDQQAASVSASASEEERVHGYPGTFFLFGHDDEEAAALLRKLDDRTQAARGAGLRVEMREVVVCPTWDAVVAAVERKAAEINQN